jgi:hypothetical protein
MHWLCCHLRGDFELPSREEQLQYIEKLAQWKAKNMTFEPCRSSTVGTRYFHYIDELMHDMSMSSRRKGNIFSHIFGKHSPNDWKNLKEQLDKKREKKNKNKKKAEV